MVPRIRSQQYSTSFGRLKRSALIGLILALASAVSITFVALKYRPADSVTKQADNLSVRENPGPPSSVHAPSPQRPESPTAAEKHAAISKATQVDRFIADGSAAGAYKAYALIRHCLDARRDQLLVAERSANNDPRPVPSVADACGDITPGQVASRLHVLQKAAQAGIHGAAMALADEGPTGEGALLDRPSDDFEQSSYNARVKEAVEVGAAHGDYWSLLSMSNRYDIADSGKPDYSLALQYYIAANDAYKSEFGQDLKSFKQETGRYLTLIPEDKASAAISAGHALYRNSQGIQ